MAEMQDNIEVPPIQPVVEDQGISHTVERKPIKSEPSASDKADTFCKIMRHPDAPASFNARVINRLKAWGLVSGDFDPSAVLGNYEEFRKVIWAAEAEAKAKKNRCNLFKLLAKTLGILMGALKVNIQRQSF